MLVILFMMAIMRTTLANAQAEPIYPVVLPGDPSLHSERMVPHEVIYKKFGGVMLYAMDRVEVEGKNTFRVQIYFNDDKSGVPDTLYFDPETLAYTGRTLVLNDYTIDVKVQDGHFTGSLTPSEGSDYNPATYDKIYEHGAFEPAIINYFIAALPLAEGYKASIPVFDLNNGSQMLWSNIEVLGRESVKIGGQTFDTWKVKSNGIREKTIWVTTSEPYAIKMDTKGVFGTWKLKL